MSGLQKWTQYGLLLMLLRSGILLLIHPSPDRLVLTLPSLFLSLSLLFFLTAYTGFFAEDVQMLRSELRQSRGFVWLLLFYFAMMLVNGAGILLLCKSEWADGGPLVQLFTNAFLSSSLLLLGLDLAVLHPVSPFLVGGMEAFRCWDKWRFQLGLLLFAILHNPGELLCLLVYLCLGFSCGLLLSRKGRCLDISLLGHLARNMVFLFLLPFYL